MNIFVAKDEEEEDGAEEEEIVGLLERNEAEQKEAGLNESLRTS